MNEFISVVKERFASFEVKDAIDVLILFAILFLFFRFIRRRRAFPILLGVLGYAVFSVLAKYFGLSAITAVTSTINGMAVVLLAVVFQSEIRAALERSGDSIIAFFRNLNKERNPSKTNNVIENIVDAVFSLSEAKIGAIIVIEQNTGTEDVAKYGVKLDSLISAELIKNIFCKDSPLHDGAIVIRGGRIHTAASYVVVSGDYVPLTSAYGARHNAGTALSSNSDGIVIIVSEEDGTISIAQNGELEHEVNDRELRNHLKFFYPRKISEKRQVSDLGINVSSEEKEKITIVVDTDNANNANSTSSDIEIEAENDVTDIEGDAEHDIVNNFAASKQGDKPSLDDNEQ